MVDLSNTLIIGSSGFLGRKFLTILKQRFNKSIIGTSYSKIVEDLISLDVTKYNQISNLLNKKTPSLVINCSAFTDVDQSEKNWFKAFEVNTSGNYYIAAVAKELNIPYISFSTDYVFKGRPDPYFETTKPDPISVYGKTKLLGEIAIHLMNDENIVVRVPILYGYNSSEDKLTLPTSVIKAYNQKTVLKISDPRPKYPVLIDDVVENTLKLIENEESGIFHFSTQEPITKYNWALMTAQVFQKDPSLIEQDNPRYASYKPSNVLLLNTRVKTLKFNSVKEGLQIIKSQISDNRDEC